MVSNPSGRETLPECIAICSLTPKDVLVAVGGTDPRIQLYSARINDGILFSFLTYLDGHRDWIRGLAFSNMDSGFYLASASKDSTARMWKILSDAPEADSDSFLPSPTITVNVSDRSICLTAIALLDEHTAAVHSVSFAEAVDEPHILTSSMDCTVAVWKLLQSNAVCVARFGLMGGQSAHALGFFGAEFPTSGVNRILAHNFSGALHRWEVANKSGSLSYEYFAHPAPTGHFDKVTDLAWAPNGSFLLSCSSDKTTRVYAENDGSFVEWARPQVHGHSIFTLSFCNPEGTGYVSGAEERMLRVFEAPSSFRLPGKSSIHENKKPVSASLPQLGLSNKAIFTEDAADDPSGASDMIVSTFGVRKATVVAPLEENLKQSRLWPEKMKMYGHGNEISAVAVHFQSGVIASACRSQTEKDAVILLWDVESGAECARLPVHELTVNELRFTPDGKHLLSVSRDRSISVFVREDLSNRFGFRVQWHKKGAHTRELYCCTWVSEGEIVATGGRDKCLRMFSSTGEDENLVNELLKQKFASGVTALDALRLSPEDRRSFLALGFENGFIRFFSVVWDDGHNIRLSTLHNVESNARCGGRVTRIRWRPIIQDTVDRRKRMQIAAASEDYSVRVYSVRLEENE
ncbi:Elongator complex protein [Gracilaria domingensis]|nr:Elongator complex protein [Gracilaria domingensis]